MGIPVIKLLKSLPDVFGLHSGEQPHYEVLERDGLFEIRHYAGYRVAKTFVQGEYGLATGIGFRRLADYIVGKNKKRSQMTMAVPVFEGKIGGGQAASVLQQDNGDGWAIAFVMPEKYTLPELPKQDDPRIALEEMPEQLIAALRYSGCVNEAAISEKKQELLAWLREKGRYALQGKVVSAQYDPPFTIPFLKRNEVMVRLAIPAPRRAVPA